MRLNTTELAAAEAFLTAGFPEIDIAQLEGKAASGGVTIADLEPLLLEHLGATNDPARIEVVVEKPAPTPPKKKGLLSFSARGSGGLDA